MAKVTMNSLPAILTQEEMAELEAAEKMPVTFDDDCPEMTSEMLEQFHRMDKVTIRISPSNMKKVKSLGADYTKILNQLLELALNDAELVKKCM
ncbi:MAG: antitoxin [Lachnospiraceae bacterium]|nr:antitoxin [Lachnospiraceae bacterium]